MRYLQLVLAIFIPAIIFSQPINDDCINAIEITDVANYCSAFGEFNNFGATPSIPSDYICIPNETSARDVWFKFTATANFIHLTVNGKSLGNPGGTLVSPQVILFSGPCNALVEQDCFSDAFGINSLEVFEGPLVPGQTYYINISARDNHLGTFQLCLNNYNQNFVPDGDCPTSRVLCDKSSVFIEAVFNPGNITDEIPLFSCVREEIASSWFRWTCSKSGTLTIKLTPTKPEDDLDFALFELPNGIDDCNGKKQLRCGAAGENVGEPYNNWKQCTGPTGLNLTSTDINEEPGCNNGNDNWVKYIDMVEGVSYAFFVNNFSQSGQGYTMEFGGTGEFLGARASFDVTPDGTCYEDTLHFINTSIAPTDPIVSYQWEFGANSNIGSSTQQNPPGVIYDGPGYKSVSLTITSQDGCVHTYTKNFIAKCCIDPLKVSMAVQPYNEVKLGDPIILTATTENAVGSTIFEWFPSDLITNCFNCREVTLVPVGNYIFTVTAQDQKGCISTDSLEIRVVDSKDVVAPNVFSPNYDGINDYFTVFPNRGAKFIKRLLVFNRWGACVYEGKELTPGDDTIGWDGTFKGKECTPDVYAYFAEVEFLNGRIQIIKGDVTLVR